MMVGRRVAVREPRPAWPHHGRGSRMTALQARADLAERVDERAKWVSRTYRPRSVSSLLIRFSAMSGYVVWVVDGEMRRRGVGALLNLRLVSSSPVEGHRTRMNRPAGLREVATQATTEQTPKRGPGKSKGLPRNRRADCRSVLQKGLSETKVTESEVVEGQVARGK
jgi:hypothetical protein